MPVRPKIDITEEEAQKIEKEYFKKIAKKKPDELELYKKCYYAEKSESEPFTAKEKKIRQKAYSNIWFTMNYRYNENFRDKRYKKKEKIKYKYVPDYQKMKMVKVTTKEEERILTYAEIQKELGSYSKKII